MNVTLVLLEVSDIQRYVFGSNHLAQNIGASELVMQATTDWVYDILQEMNLQPHSNVQAKAPEGLRLNDETISGGLQVEVVYAGGGNTMLLFADETVAQTFVQQLSSHVLRQAPNLKLVMDWRSFDWQQEALTAVHATLRQQLSQRKRASLPAMPLPGLSVTMSCVFTGLPAVGYDDDPQIVGDEAAKRIADLGERPRPISAEVAAKLRAEPAGKDRLHALLPEVHNKGFLFVYDFDQIGNKDESSYIAVCHTDGNGMGDRFEALAGQYAQPAQNDAYVYNLRRFSESIQANANDALRETVDYLLASLDQESKFGGKISVPKPVSGGQRLYLPFRPIVFGGDDVTFVGDGRIGLNLAAQYVQAFSRSNLTDGQPAYARAGVAVVHTHYPFSRAYDLAAALTSSAKQAIPVLRKPQEPSANALDWHFATTGFLFDLAEIRQREHTSALNTSLLMRPIYLDHAGNDQPHHWRTWSNLVRLLDAFQDEEVQKEEKKWANKRNKIKGLAEALRRGPDATQIFLRSYNPPLELPSIPGEPDMRQKGWAGSNCGYFDALEALDFYVSLEPGKVPHA